MDQPEAGSSPQRSFCGCGGLNFLRRAIKSDKSEGRGSAETATGSSTDSAALKDPTPGPPAAEPVTLKPQLTGRRSRSDSPKSEGGADEQPVKRQNSMGHDDPAIGPPGGVQPMEEAAASPSSSRQGQARTNPSLALPQPLHHQHLRQPGSPTHHTVANACPPFGSKSVIGRRAKMEDACVAVPYLVEVPVGRGGMDELLPPRIAPQLRSSSLNSAASDQTAAAALAASGGSSGSPSGGQQQQQLQSAFADVLDPRAAAGCRHEAIHTEVLHFFGVFDGHGGADAALHCARSLHEQVRDVLSACSTSAGADLRPARSKEHSSAAPQASSSSETGGHRRSGASGGRGGNEEAPTSRHHHAGSGGSGFQDATGDLQSCSSAGSYLDADFDEEASNSVLGVSCTTETIEAALTKAFHITDEEFGKMGGYEHLALVGTTAVVALVGSRMIYVANCGDSRAVLCRSGGALPLTDDHKAAREDETARVEAAGGQILFWNGVRVMGLLAVSRAIGDHSLRPYVIAEPEVTIITRHRSDEVLVMASDGLWDVMSNQEAVTLAKKCLGRARSRGSTRQSAARVAATVLTRAAVDRGSRDNVTVVIVDLSPMTAAEMEAESSPTERFEIVPEVPQRPSGVAHRQPPSAVAVRSSDGRGPAGAGQQAPPPVQVSPFAGAAAAASPPPAPAPSPFAEAAPAAPPAAGAAGDEQRPGIALVSPFSSGALPAGLDFDVRQHANAEAAAAAAAAAGPSAVGQHGSAGTGVQQAGGAGGGGGSN